MKKKLLSFMVVSFFVFASNSIAQTNDPPVLDDGEGPVLIDPNDDGSSGGYECSATTKCFDWTGREVGSVSCSGNNCERGQTFVKCDGKKTSC